MGAYFSKFYFGGPFELFSLSHLAALAVILLLNLLIWSQRKKFTPAAKNRLRWMLAAILLFFQSAWFFWLLMVGEANLRTALPLHLCNLMVFLSAGMLILKSRTLFGYTYFLGMGGALTALLMPDLGIYGFPHILFFQTFIVHGSLLTAQVFMAVIEGYQPAFLSLFKSFAALNIYVPIIAIFNALFSTNYLFLTAKPGSPTLLDYLGSPPWYYVWVELIILLGCFLLYVPFYLQKRQRSASR